MTAVVASSLKPPAAPQRERCSTNRTWTSRDWSGSGEGKNDPRVATMLVASTMNYGWLARLVASHRPNVTMVAFYSNPRTGR